VWGGRSPFWGPPGQNTKNYYGPKQPVGGDFFVLGENPHSPFCKARTRTPPRDEGLFCFFVSHVKDPDICFGFVLFLLFFFFFPFFSVAGTKGWGGDFVGGGGGTGPPRLIEKGGVKKAAPPKGRRGGAGLRGAVPGRASDWGVGKKPLFYCFPPVLKGERKPGRGFFLFRVACIPHWLIFFF